MSALTQPETTQTVRLQQAHPPPSPTDLTSKLGIKMSEAVASLNLPPSLLVYDCYGDNMSTPSNSYLRAFEAEVAADLGFESAVFMPSGVMAQQIALLINAGPGNARGRFVCHKSSHLLIHEKDSWKDLLQMHADVIDSNGPLTFEDIVSACVNTEDTPHTVFLEHPHRELGGQLTSFSDLQKISLYCRSNNVKFHMDGARLWEASGSLEEEHRSASEICKLFDSAYVSFYKGLGGLAGSMLLGDTAFCASARVWLRRFGGNLFTLAPFALTAWAGYRARYKQVGPGAVPASFEMKARRMREWVLSLAPGDEAEGRRLRFNPPMNVVCMVHCTILGCTSKDAVMARDAVEAKTKVRVFERIRAESADGVTFEWVCGDENYDIPAEIVVKAWDDFQSELEQIKTRV